jgi:predicted  nucleic acid-binding Zn-ribbon protein
MEPSQATDREQNRLQAENERLSARVRELEAELVEVQARTNAAVAQWQERAYWLDRWHLDLNALMRRRGAAEFRALVRALRAVVWGAKRARRRLRER